MRTAALALVTLASLTALALPEDAAEWERNVDAVAPGEDTATTLIVDAMTGRPIPGARLTWYAEVEGLRAPALGTAVANAWGLATLDWTELATWDADGHFLVTADGYAAAHEYGKLPPDEIELVRGRDVSARIVDLLGRPVADADVEVFLGCGHGPILDFVQTDADGRVTVSGQDVDEAQLWVEAAGTAADYLPLDDADGLGAGERVLRLAPGGIAEGVVLDSAGRPLEGVEVRSFQRHRGPVGMTDRRGRFRLVGVEDEASLYFGHPHAMEGWAILDGDRWRSGVPLRLYLTPWGFATPTQDRAYVVLRARTPDGRVIHAPEIALLGDTDGLVHHADAEEPVGVLHFRELPPGLYVPVPSHKFAGWDVEPTPVSATRSTPPVTLQAVPRPRLRIDGTIPGGARTHLAVEGAEGSSLDVFLGDGALAVPRDGPLAVTVTWLGRAWVFAAGPEEDGFRTVEIALPEPHLLRLPEDLRGEFELLHRGIACDLESVDEGFVTFASGELVLRVDTGDAILAIPLSLPAEPGSEVEVVAPDRGTQRLLRIVPPDGVRARMSIEITEESGGGFGLHAVVDGPIEKPISGPAWVRVERDDHVVWQRRVAGPAEVRFGWGDAALTFRVVDDGGDHVPTTVLVDGTVVPQRDPDDFSVVRVLGLGPGAHDVLLLPHDDAFFAKELRMVLQPGETRRRRIELTPR